MGHNSNDIKYAGVDRFLHWISIVSDANVRERREKENRKWVAVDY